MAAVGTALAFDRIPFLSSDYLPVPLLFFFYFCCCQAGGWGQRPQPDGAGQRTTQHSLVACLLTNTNISLLTLLHDV